MSIPLQKAGQLAVLAILAGTILLTGWVLLAVDWRSESTRPVPESFVLDVADQWHTEPSLLAYEQSAAIDIRMERARAIAAGPAGRIFVAGGRTLLSLAPDGQQQRTIALGADVRSVVVAGDWHQHPGRIYVAETNQVEVFAPDGARLATWTVPVDGCWPASIAVTGQEVFLADSAGRQVLRFDLDGQLTGSIGAADSGGQVPGFIVPSACFDVAASQQDQLHIVNPGARRIETYSPEGQLISVWGSAKAQIDGFFGCCNPAHLALLPDGRFVTSEKGIPRIKVYSVHGEFESVVAGPEQLSVSAASAGDPRGNRDQAIFDIAADHNGRILVLDAAKSRVLIFGARPASTESANEKAS